MHAELKQIFLDVLEIDSISENDSVETVKNWDSVRHLSLIMALEERFGVSFDAEQIPQLLSVRAIEEALGRRTMAAG